MHWFISNPFFICIETHQGTSGGGIDGNSVNNFIIENVTLTNNVAVSGELYDISFCVNYHVYSVQIWWRNACSKLYPNNNE